MPLDLKCGEGRRIYTNRSKKEKSVTVTINDKCEGEDGPTVALTDPETGMPLTEEEEKLPKGGGTVTFDVPPKRSLWADCKGDDGHGCTVEVAVS
jgi:hypothetical protein